uniref:IRF tryptophan pentad repeat domain-containing protein n=1 Tax=Amazona collaria TaxID=241587 RepID=A0A8B9FTK3_9PSIT
MAPGPPQRRLRAWLLEQVESGRYAGLVWDDPERTALRIPWQRGGKGGAGSALCKVTSEGRGRGFGAGGGWWFLWGPIGPYGVSLILRSP